MQIFFSEDIIKATVPYSSWSQYSILYFSYMYMHTFYYEKKNKVTIISNIYICLNKSNKKLTSITVFNICSYKLFDSIRFDSHLKFTPESLEYQNNYTFM